MTLKAIIVNGQQKRILAAVELIEAVTTTIRAVAFSTQQAFVTASLRPLAATTTRLAPHFTCSAESKNVYMSKQKVVNLVKLR